MTSVDPTSASAAPHPRLFVRWFIQYNPMFTASALCVLGGVLSASRGFGTGADEALTAVLELYQALVIGVAGLLYRRLLERRPAAMLGLISLVFLIDPTLQVGALAASGHGVATAVWVLLFAAKWRALEWAFALRVSWSARLLPVTAAVIVAAVANARMLGVDDALLPSLVAAAVAAIGVGGFLFRPTIASRRALGEVGAIMFPRIQRAAVVIGLGGLAYQMWNALLAVGPRAMGPAIFAFILVGVLATGSRTQVVGVLLVEAFFIVMAHRRGVLDVVDALAPHGASQWGTTLLVAGFLLLPAGVVLHRRFARLVARDDAVRALEAGGPSSPAGIGMTS